MLEIHLYGKLRRYAADSNPRSESVAMVPWEGGGTIADLVKQLGIPLEELGTNIFLNGRYAALSSPIKDGDRVGLFPDDMQLLYKWYFAPSSSSAASNLSTEDPASGSGRSESGGEGHEK